MTDQLNKLAEEAAEKCVGYNRPIFTPETPLPISTEFKRKQFDKCKSDILSALQRAVELERERVVVQNNPVISVALGCSVCGEVEHRNNYSSTLEWIKAAGEWAEKHRQSCGKIELRKQGEEK